MVPLEPGSKEQAVGQLPKVPSDLEAQVGYHIDTKDPSKKERVFGYLHLKTTDINQSWGLGLPLGNAWHSKTIRASLAPSSVAPPLGVVFMPLAPPVSAPTTMTRKSSPLADPL